jgi:capsular exopolysaccharide synthesis family protein
MSLTDKFMLCVRYWPWFLLSFLITMGITTLYLLSTPKYYTRTSSILVKSSSEQASYEIKVMEDLGVNNLTTDISDEVVAIHSPAAVYEMVKRLRLDIQYFRPGIFRDEPLYASTLPVEVVFENLKDDETASFTLEITKKGTAIMSNLVYRGEEINKNVVLKLGQKSLTPYGYLTVVPTLSYQKGTEEKIHVHRSGYFATAARYGSLIQASIKKKSKNIIDLVCVDACIPRADNILSTIVNIYNENWVKNRNQISVATNDFIKERLAVIEKELGHVDANISDYKSVRAMPDVNAAAGVAQSQMTNAEQQRQQINNQLYMVRYVRSYITGGNHANQLLPASTGIGNSSAESQISEYNNMLLQRNNLVANSSEQNPLVQDLDTNLKNLRSAIVNSLDNEIVTLNAQLGSVQSAHSQAIAKLSINPRQANDLLSIERQQKVKESLYLFLLQKREENELSQAFSAYNTRLIAEPHGSNSPTSPESSKILLIAFALSMAIPAIFFISRENMNTRVRGRKDLEDLSVPFIGELPFWKPKKSKDVDTEKQIIVKHKKRDIINEAFRVVRTNLEFMTNPDQKSKIIMLTSFNPSSGKTFITANLGASFALRGSRVIAIDLDLRRASLSEYVGLPKKGITEYLSGHGDDYHSLILRPEDTGIDILPVGKMPPNPTELLYSPKLKPMLDELRQQYDYIFVDCPPVEIVADATIISREADVTLFVIRAGLLERSMLPELEKSYLDKKYNNIAMLLNGTDASSSYGYHRYGYGYGRYGYGYGKYGYSYYGSKKKKS